MYARQVKKKVLSFGVSGNLWNDALVMYDRETNSLWSHVTGESIEGEFLGTHLEALPSTMMPFQEWVERYPDSKFVVREEGAVEGSHYERYFSSDRQGIFGTEAKRKELGPKEIVQGVAYEGKGAAIVAAAVSDQQPASFLLAGDEFIARQEGSTIAVFKKNKDGSLEPYPSTPVFWFGWINFYPNSVVIR